MDPFKCFLWFQSGHIHFFWRNFPQFYVTFSRFANPGKMLEITWYSQNEVAIFSYIHQFNIETICQRRNEIPDRILHRKLCFSFWEYLIFLSFPRIRALVSVGSSLVHLIIWKQPQDIHNSEPRNWERKFLSAIWSASERPLVDWIENNRNVTRICEYVNRIEQNQQFSGRCDFPQNAYLNSLIQKEALGSA
jgi:hypothetical protein